MVDHTIQIAVPIFKMAFSGCVGPFAFDNASNYNYFAENALIATRMNLPVARWCCTQNARRVHAWTCSYSTDVISGKLLT
jgi:hypothetical protein